VNACRVLTHGDGIGNQIVGVSQLIQGIEVAAQGGQLGELSLSNRQPNGR
jgi:hypothetical protein